MLLSDILCPHPKCLQITHVTTLIVTAFVNQVKSLWGGFFQFITKCGNHYSLETPYSPLFQWDIFSLVVGKVIGRNRS